MSKLTKAREALLLMAEMGQVRPCVSCGYVSTFEELAGRGRAYRVGRSGSYSITPAGRAALEAKTQ